MGMRDFQRGSGLMGKPGDVGIGMFASPLPLLVTPSNNIMSGVANTLGWGLSDASVPSNMQLKFFGVSRSGATFFPSRNTSLWPINMTSLQSSSSALKCLLCSKCDRGPQAEVYKGREI